MARNTFPPTDIPEVALDESTLAELIEVALSAAIHGLTGQEIECEARQVTRPTTGGFETVDLSGPRYSPTIWKESDRLSRLPESLALGEYLWARGAFRKTFTRDDGGEVPRSAWERAVWGELLHSTLQWLLEDAATEDLVVLGKCRPWYVRPSAPRLAAAEIAQRVIQKRRTIHAECLLGIPKIESAHPIELSAGIFVEQLSLIDQCIHLTKYHNDYSSDDMHAVFFNVRLSVRRTVADLSEHAAALAVSESIDRVKWAISVAAQRDFAIAEGPAIIRGPDGLRCRTLRRHALSLGSLRTEPPPPDEYHKASAVLRTLDQATQLVPTLRKSLGLFGRSCVANLARDSLLDSMIGIDSLLVPGGGEGRYRVALHGSALLSYCQDAPTSFEQLSELYGLRSAAAHSGDLDEKKFVQMAPVARVCFAQIIYAVATLIQSGLIALAPRRTLPQAVEFWIRERLFDGVRRSWQKN